MLAPNRLEPEPMIQTAKATYSMIILKRQRRGRGDADVSVIGHYLAIDVDGLFLGVLF